MRKPYIEEKIFKNRSSTFYTSAKFFPPAIQQDVAALYSFVRIADDYVDVYPQKIAKLEALRNSWQKKSVKLDPVAKKALENIFYIQKKYQFEDSWVEAFFDSMFIDVNEAVFYTLADSLSYVYGSGEVIGLMMAKIMNVPQKAWPYAKIQGRAFQWINFIRDIEEDTSLGRCYFPKTDLKRFGLKDLTLPTTGNFNNFIKFELNRYKKWQNEAAKGYKFIPQPARVAVEVSAASYEQTAQTIAREPMGLFKKGTRPQGRSIPASAHQ